MARWLAHGRTLPALQADLTVNDIILAYDKHAEGYYRPGADGKPSTELGCIRDALKVLKALFGRTAAKDFGPKKLKAVRQHMLEKGWCRTYANHQVDRVRRVFRWAVSEEMLPGDVYHALQAVPGLRRGLAGVRESEPVRPVPEAFVNAALPFMPPTVRAMVDLQLLTGMRPGETCIMRAIDIDMSGRVWTYRPETHKTAHHGHERTIYIGPKAQEVIRPWLSLDATAYLFSPANAEAMRNAERRQQRKTPLWPSHVRRLERKRKATPKRAKRDRYDVTSYRRAIKRACKLADQKAHEDNPEVPAEEVIIPTWHPHLLRHNAATNLRRGYGVELARIVLGHATAFTTEIYAEVDRQQAMEVIAEVG